MCTSGGGAAGAGGGGAAGVGGTAGPTRDRGSNSPGTFTGTPGGGGAIVAVNGTCDRGSNSGGGVESLELPKSLSISFFHQPPGPSGSVTAGPETVLGSSLNCVPGAVNPFGSDAPPEHTTLVSHRPPGPPGPSPSALTSGDDTATVSTAGGADTSPRAAPGTTTLSASAADHGARDGIDDRRDLDIAGDITVNPRRVWVGTISARTSRTGGPLGQCARIGPYRERRERTKGISATNPARTPRNAHQAEHVGNATRRGSTVGAGQGATRSRRAPAGGGLDREIPTPSPAERVHSIHVAHTDAVSRSAATRASRRGPAADVPGPPAG